MEKEKKYDVVEITFINENGERITFNLESYEISPKNLSHTSQVNAILRTGVFIDAGVQKLKNSWEPNHVRPQNKE